MYHNLLILFHAFRKLMVTSTLSIFAFSILSGEVSARNSLNSIAQSDSKFFESIIKLHTAEYPEDGPFIKIFERGGGDPAYNGTHVFLTIMFQEQARTWHLGLNIREIIKIELKPDNTIVLSVNEDCPDNSGRSTLKHFVYIVQFALVNHKLQEKVYIDTDKPRCGKGTP